MKIRNNLSPYQYAIAKYIPWFRLENPVFLLGCGRSGTTIIGKSISLHADVAYLNEPRWLWFDCYPSTDIWTQDSIGAEGQMVLTELDVDNTRSRKLKALLDYERRKMHAKVLVEKTPVNNFRLPFIRAIFPQARYICIFRNGLEVAHSIEKIASSGHWFGYDAYKWKQIADTAAKLGLYPDLEDFPRNDFERGLLEWRISNQYLLDFLNGMPNDQYINLTYSQFVEEPVEVISKVFTFLGLTNNDKITQFLIRNISRMTKKYDSEYISERYAEIGGVMLCQIGR